MNYRFGDVVLVSFPFTDQSASKQRLQPKILPEKSSFRCLPGGGAYAFIENEKLKRKIQQAA